MHAPSRIGMSVVGFCGLVIAGSVLLSNQPAHSQQSDAPRVKWEYKADTVEAAGLETKLAAFGNEGWEVFSVVRSKSVIDTGADGKPRVVAEEYQLSARRPLKR